jgi:hypothetical protein
VIQFDSITPSLWSWSNCVHSSFGEIDHFVAARMENISTVDVDMPATANGPAHQEVTKCASTAMADLSPNSVADQTRMSPTQPEEETHPQNGLSADFLQDVQP